jgi:hypothetical protein
MSGAVMRFIVQLSFRSRVCSDVGTVAGAAKEPRRFERLQYPLARRRVEVPKPLKLTPREVKAGNLLEFGTNQAQPICHHVLVAAQRTSSHADATRANRTTRAGNPLLNGFESSTPSLERGACRQWLCRGQGWKSDRSIATAPALPEPPVYSDRGAWELSRRGCGETPNDRECRPRSLDEPLMRRCAIKGTPLRTQKDPRG